MWAAKGVLGAYNWAWRPSFFLFCLHFNLQRAASGALITVRHVSHFFPEFSWSFMFALHVRYLNYVSINASFVRNHTLLPVQSVGQEGLGWVRGREQIRVRIRRSRVMIRHEIRRD